MTKKTSVISAPSKWTDSFGLSRKLSKGIQKYKVRLITLGDPAVGKSSFLDALVKGGGTPGTHAQRGVNGHLSQVNKVVRHGDHEVELDIRDTAGQERYRSLTASYYRNAHGCLLFFNVFHKQSFDNLEQWVDDINTHSKQDNIPVILVGLLHRVNTTKPTPWEMTREPYGGVWSNRRSNAFGRADDSSSRGGDIADDNHQQQQQQQ
ncbi:GTP-binding protein Rab-3D, partial [Aplysia californica]|uniref:GTP-binding protein Rab-3D n=1 Tax=Aplysia californica TaxID=6500 RepID=A0ABM0K2P8_APLCA